jgi:hypothetical protein
MPAIQCPTCQKQYTWKPELAGRRVKCKCGTVINVPAEVPSAGQDELYDLADSPRDQDEHSIGDLQGLAAPTAVQESNQFRCPYCGQDLEAGATMCVFCGTSFEQRAAAKRKPASAMAAAPPVSGRPVTVKADTTDRGAMIKIAIIAMVGIAVVVGAVFGLKKFSGKSPDAVDPNLSPADKSIVEKISDENGVEARGWINAADNHQLGTGWNTKQALFNIDRWYNLGATKVYAFGAGISLTAVIELPTDAAKRKALFDWAIEWNRNLPIDLRSEPPKDTGQKYLEISAPR